MLTNTQEKQILKLQTKKGRREFGLTLVEGQKNVSAAGKAVQWTFTPEESKRFFDMATTETPQDIIGVARIPSWNEEEILASDIVVILDGVQDPGNVGAILRLCLGFGASVIAIESADISSPKVVRASAGALFTVPWMTLSRPEAAAWVTKQTTVGGRNVYKLEKTSESVDLAADTIKKPCIIIAGSEGNGITLGVDGTSVAVKHADALESLNVTHALAITLWSTQQ